MKKILLPLVAATSILAAVSAQAAGSASKPFNVTVNLTSACTVTTPTPVTFTYTALQTTPASSAAGDGAFTVTCTKNLPYTLSTAAGGTFATVNLAYTLSLSGSGANGSGGADPYSISGTMAANQAGTCATASCSDTQSQTITVSY